ncbi:hypothetical protein QTP88_014988 [Uroleucon formosanum]
MVSYARKNPYMPYKIDPQILILSMTTQPPTHTLKHRKLLRYHVLSKTSSTSRYRYHCIRCIYNKFCVSCVYTIQATDDLRRYHCASQFSIPERKKRTGERLKNLCSRVNIDEISVEEFSINIDHCIRKRNKY